MSKNAGGRPLEGFKDNKNKYFPKDWYKIILTEYENGASDVEIKAIIIKWRGKFSNGLFNRWIDEEVEFSQTIKTGRILSEAWFQKHGRKNLTNKDFSYTGWYMQMKNRFGWADNTNNKTETTAKIQVVEMTKEERKERLKILKSKL